MNNCMWTTSNCQSINVWYNWKDVVSIPYRSRS